MTTLETNIDFKTIRERIINDKLKRQDENCLEKNILNQTTKNDVLTMNIFMKYQYDIPTILQLYFDPKIICTIQDRIILYSTHGMVYSRIVFTQYNLVMDLIVHYSKQINIKIKILKQNNIPSLVQKVVIQQFTRKSIEYIKKHYLYDVL